MFWIFIANFLLIISHASQNYTNISINNLKQTTGISFTGQTPQDLFGCSVANAGDFNDDGYNDLVIGSYGGFAGSIYVIFGNKNGLLDITLTSGLSSNQGMVIYGVGQGDQLGISVSYAGDINDDGIDDIIVGACQYDRGTGVVYVIYGSKNPPSVINLKDGLTSDQGFAIIGAATPLLLGISVSWAGDVNNDKIDDFIIGANGFSGYKGAAYVIFGRKGLRANISLASNLNPSEGFAIIGALINDNLGYSVSKAGDINNDGIADVFVGAYGVNGNTGAAYVIYGRDGSKSIFGTIDLSPGLSPSEGFTISGSSSSSYLGMSVGFAGDFNHDGVDDVLIGAVYENGFRGVVYVIYGKNSLSDITLSSGLDPTRGVIMKGANIGDVFGVSVGSVGDINGDGIDDIAIGAQQANGATGVAYVIFGSKNPESEILIGDGLGPQQGFSIIGNNAGDLFGASVNSAGDINQDGMPDIIVGAYGVNGRAGAAYVLFSPLICSDKCIQCSATWTCLVCEKGMELVNGFCVVPKSSLGTAVQISKGLFDSGSTVSRIFTMGRSLSVGLGLMAKIIQNVRYLNISYPVEALNAFQNYGTDLFELPIPEILYESPDTKGLPSQYSRYDIDPSFLENYWQTIMIILMTLACFLVTRLIQFLTKRQNKGHIVQIGLKNIGQTAANFLIIQIYSNLDDVIFYFLLDASSTKMSSVSAGISMGAAGFFLILGLTLVFFHCWVLSKYQQAKREDNLESFQRKFRVVGTLYEDFKDDSAVKQSFFGILILRCVFLVLVIMLLQPPWIQTSLLMLTNLIFLGYFIYQRPFKSKFDEISQYFCEFTIFAAYLSVLVLSIFDFKEDGTPNARSGFGKCIVIAGIVLSLGGFIIQVIQIIGAIYGICQFCKGYLKKEIKVSPVYVNETKRVQKNSECSSILKDNSQLDFQDQLESSTLPLKTITTSYPQEKLRNKLEISSSIHNDVVILESKFSALQGNKMNADGFLMSERISEPVKLGLEGSQTERVNRNEQFDLNGETDILAQIETLRKRKKFQKKVRFSDAEEIEDTGLRKTRVSENKISLNQEFI